MFLLSAYSSFGINIIYLYLCVREIYLLRIEGLKLIPFSSDLLKAVELVTSLDLILKRQTFAK